MKKPCNIKNMLNTKAVVILHNEDTTHEETLYQAISGLVKTGFASETEIVSEWKNLIDMWEGQL